MEKKLKMLVWGIVIIVVIIIVVLFLMPVNKTAIAPVVNNVTQNQATPTPTTASSISTISYAKALVTYADRRIQLDANCQATPNKVTYKDNTGIMIDNRSAKTRTITVGTTFTIKPYGFKIVVLPDVYLKAKTVYVNCDKEKNVATILVQE